MKVKRKTIILRVIGIIICALLFCGYWTVWRVERVRVSGFTKDIGEYENYYYKTELKWVRGWFGQSYAVNIIYFKPGQKAKMLEKIKEDVTNYLETLIEKHGDIYYKYEISDDFKKVCIYVTQGGVDTEERYYLGPEVNIRISSLVAVYHNIKEGPDAITNGMLKIIEPDD